MAESVYFRFSTAGQPDDMFTVIRFRGEEGISTLYRFRIDLLADDSDLDVDTLQNEPSTFVIGAGGHERTIQGIIDEIEIVDQPNGVAIYRIELVPRVYELTRGTTNQVYIDNSTPDVIHQIMDRIGMTSVDFELELDQDYREWEFRLQYGESYWNFLARILERDGIYYYFTADGESEKVHFCDSARHQPAIGPDTLRFVAGLGFESSEVGETVHSLVSRRSRLLKRITLRNYNDAKPSTRITADVEVDPNGAGEADIYGQKVLDQAEADALAGIRAEELRATREQYHGESTVCLLTPAHRFELQGHPRERANREYQIVTIEHHGYDPRTARQIGEEPETDAPAYDNRFTAIPADTQYRHPQTTERPAIQGTLNARVDAAGDGQYAELDDEGRYHIVFPFDTVHPSGKASHWVRMMQPYAGEREGMHFPLRKGARVLISFLSGDPDLPVINGAITNSEQPSTTTGDNQTRGTIRTPGGNSIETDDNYGFEQLSLGSRNVRTRLRLGADPHPTGIGTSVGASATRSTADPSAPGTLSETDGMSRAAYFGGTHRFTGTNAWAIPQALWQDTRTKRDDEFADADDLEDIKDYASVPGEDWRVKHGPNRVFRFPRKHPIPDGSSIESDAEREPASDSHLTLNEEAEGRLLISRTVGDEYSYRSGTTFSFHGMDRESFDFGPMSSFSSVDHNESADDLRAIVTGTVDGFSTDPSTYMAQYRKLEQLRADRDKKWRTLQDRETRLQVLSEKGQRESDEEGYTTALSASSLLFTSKSDFDEWADLANVDGNLKKNTTHEEVKTEDGSDAIHVAYPDWINENDPPGSDSVKKATSEFDEAQKKFEEAKSKYIDDKHPIWPTRMRNNRVSVTRGDLFTWHVGDIFDFGGCWNYNLGNGYEENHLNQSAEVNADGHDWDLLNHGGPTWTSIDIAAELLANTEVPGFESDDESMPKRWTQDAMSVSKTIGDQYGYHNGADISVHVGPSEEVRKGGPNVFRKYSGSDHLTLHEKAADGVSETWRNHPNSGAPMFYNRETLGEPGHGGGRHAFTTEFTPASTLAINASTVSAVQLSLAVTNNMSLEVGASTAVSVSAGAKAAINIAAAASFDFSFSTSQSLAINISKGLQMEVKSSSVISIEANLTSQKISVETPVGSAEMNLHATTVRAAVAEIRQANIDLENKTLEIGNSGMELR